MYVTTCIAHVTEDDLFSLNTLVYLDRNPCASLQTV